MPTAPICWGVEIGLRGAQCGRKSPAATAQRAVRREFSASLNRFVAAHCPLSAAANPTLFPD